MDTTIAHIESLSDPKAKIRSYDELAANSWYSGDYKKALIYADRGLKISKELKLNKSTASLYNHKGIAYDYLGNYSEALNCYFKGLRYVKNEKSGEIEANLYSNIGLIYASQGLYEKALDYYDRSLRIHRRNKDELGICASLNNKAIVYAAQDKYTDAIKMYEECIRLDSKNGEERGLGDDYNNIGICYLDMGDLTHAREYLDKALTIRLKQEDKLGVSETYTNIATLYQKKSDWEKAKEYYLLSLPISKSIGRKESLRYAYQNLHTIEEELGNAESALNYYKQYILYRDSLENLDQARQQTELELNYNYEKEKERERLKQEKKDEQARLILYGVVGFALLLLIFFLLLYKRWKYAKLQQAIIEEKTKLVQIKNDEILDSITYAKRIQTAILPSEELVNKWLPENFVLYLPKDIVAGDFYWFEEHNERYFLAVADCTGHGVPGALMSVVCHNALNRALREFNLTDPGQLLNKTREIIIDDLSKNQKMVSDGMDISLCTFDKKSSTLNWSGANNPLWIYRADTKEIEVIKGDKQPIGMHFNLIPFTTHTVTMEPNDRIYLFTDGIADQFGGEGSKKLMIKNFKNWLLESAEFGLTEQKLFLEEEFDRWKGDNDQVDDVCLIGFMLLTKDRG